MKTTIKWGARKQLAAFTLAEIGISTAISVMTVAAVMIGYVSASKRAEWSGYSLAAQSLALQNIEMARAAKWDPQGYPPTDQLTGYVNTTYLLDIPVAGTNRVYATNFTTITYLSSNPPLKMIRVDCVWRFPGRGNFTNTVVTYRTADQ